MRSVLLFCFILVTDQRFVSSSPRPSKAAATGTRSAGSGSNGSPSCRCAPDQFEAVLRSVEREINLHVDTQNSATMMDIEYGDYERTAAADAAGAAAGRDEEGYRDSQQLNPDGAAAELESTTSVYYDYTNGLLATFEHGERVKTIVDHATGVQYIISPEGSCRRTTVIQRMKRMCLPDGAVMTAEFSIGFNQLVSMWKFIGPNNSTLRTMVDRRRCVPVTEETFAVSDGYASVTSIVYSNIRVGIRDKRVFNPPPSCLEKADDGKDMNAH